MQAEFEAKLHRAWLYLLVLFTVQACAATTQINVEQGASLSEYNVFEVAKVTNDTGQTFSFDITSFFTDELESALRTKGYEVLGQGDASGKLLIVNCSIVSYSAGTAAKKAAAMALGLVPGGYFMTPKDSATVKVTLIDQKTSKTMAELESSQSETESGLIPPTSLGNGHGISMISSQKLVLREAAWGVATKIDEKIKPQ
jgi:hypothetical protein